MIVLDASALLAFLLGEPGGDRVGSTIESSCLSTVNLSEVLGRFARDGHDANMVSRRIASTAIELVPFEVEDAALAAHLLPKTRALGLSLGDRACLVLGLVRGCPVLTADRSWLELDLGLEIECVW